MRWITKDVSNWKGRRKGIAIGMEEGNVYTKKLNVNYNLFLHCLSTG